jgi:hypothetical protein
LLWVAGATDETAMVFTDHHRAIVALSFAASVVLPAVSLGQDPDAAPEPDPVRFKLSGTFQYLLETDLDGGGTVDIARINGAVGADFELSEDMKLGVNFALEFDKYDFGGVSDLGPDPWDDILFLTMGAQLQFALTDQWLLWGGPVVQFAREDGADWDDAVTGGGTIGATYIVNERLVIGGGVGIASKLEDDVLVFPVITLDWQIHDRWRLTSNAGPEGIVGVGLELVYEISDAWEAGFGGRYEYRRYRLDGSGTAPDGIGEETSFPLWGRISYTFNENFGLDLFLGVGLAGELKLENSSGVRLADADYDPAFTVGLVGRVQF